MKDYSYQTKLIEVSFDNLLKNRRSVLAACPGAGKTNMAIEIIHKFIQKYPKAKVCVLTHGQTILRNQFSERMESLGKKSFKQIHRITDLKKKYPIIVALPQTVSRYTGNLNFDLLVVDEAHHFYNGAMVESIIKKSKPKYQLMMTGTPSPFISTWPIVPITVEELLPYKTITAPSIELINTNYEVKLTDYNAQNELKKSCKKLSERHCADILERILNRFDANSFKKCLIIFKNQSEATIAHKYLSKTHRSTLATSDADPNSALFKLFAKGKDQFLCVVSRGILGFDCPGLTSVIDFSLSHNTDRLFQQYCRLVRYENDQKKIYFKVTTEFLSDITEHLMYVVLHSCTKDGYLLPVDRNVPIPVGDFEGDKEYKQILDFDSYLKNVDTLKLDSLEQVLERYAREPPYSTMEEAIQAAKKYGVKCETDYHKIYTKDQRLRRNPQKLYPTWTWTVFHDRSEVYTKEECIAVLHKMGVKSLRHYRTIYKQDPRLRYNLSSLYKDWSWTIFSGHVQKRYKELPPLEEFIQFCRDKGLTTQTKYRERCTEIGTIPWHPERNYKEFTWKLLGGKK